MNLSHQMVGNASALSSNGTNSIPTTFWVFLSIETTITIIGNSVICSLFLGNRELRTRQNYYIVSLSVSDFFVGLAVPPCEYCRFVRENVNNEHCPLFCGSIISFNMIASIINLVLICTDRYLSVKRPFIYSQIFTKKRTTRAIIVSWIVTIFLSCIPIFWSSEILVDAQTGSRINIVYSKILCTLTLFAAMLLTVFYREIVKTIRLKAKNFVTPSTFPAGIWVCILSAIIFVTSWIPYCIIEILLQHKFSVPLPLMDASYFILMLSPSLDPIIYAYYRKDFRRSLYHRKRNSYLFGNAMELILPLHISPDQITNVSAARKSIRVQSICIVDDGEMKSYEDCADISVINADDTCKVIRRSSNDNYLRVSS